ncbi:MAG: hypothetical protein ACE5G2_01980 [Candidatus Krumholzibacteriia bacterium]
MAGHTMRWLLRAAAFLLPSLASQALPGQELVPQPRCDFLVVELHSVRDEVTLYPGPLQDPPYVYRGWTPAPRVELSKGGTLATLHIWDRSLLAEGSRVDSDTWEIELMPAAPAAFVIRCDRGQGNFDLSGMRVQNLSLFGSSSELRVDFAQPNPVRLESFSATIHEGKLTLRSFLNANPGFVTLRIPKTRTQIEFTGTPFQGEAEILLHDASGSLSITLPRALGVRLDGPPEVLARFDAEHLVPGEPGLASRGYESAACRVHLRFMDDVGDLKVRWEGPAPHAAAGEVPAAQPTTPVSAGDARPGAGARSAGEPQPAREKPEPVAGTPSQREAEERLRAGLDHYLRGQHAEALAEFGTAASLDPDLSAAPAWIRKTQSEMLRLEPGKEDKPAPVPEPQIIEKIVIQSAAPVFAIRSPASQNVERRSDAIELAGQVGDDMGVDHVEITLNGVCLLGPNGKKLMIRPQGNGEPLRHMPFSTTIPLREGENQIVVTAYDVDSLTHWSSEHFTVIRKPPIYRTSAFGISLGALGLVGLASVLIFNAAKYRIAIVNKYNPYIAGLPIRNPEMLFGRDKLLNNVMNTLHNNSIMLYGPRRIGKTSLQYELKRRLENLDDPEFEYVPVLIDLQGTSERQFFTTLMADILEACGPRLDGGLPWEHDEKKAAYSSRDFSRDLRKLLAALQARTDKKLKLVLLMDEVDELNKYSDRANQKLRSVFMKTFAEKVVAVMSGARINKDWRSEGSPWYNFFDEIEVEPLEPEDARKLIREPVRGIFSYDPEAVERILEHSRCRPYLIQRFCVHAINRVIEEKRRRVRVSDIEAVRPQAVKFEAA